MHTPRLLAAAALLLAGSTLATPAAEAAAPEERRLRPHLANSSGDGGSIVVRTCMERATRGQGWRVYLELDNRHGAEPARAGVVARHAGAVTARVSTGRVRAEGYSPRVSVRVPDRAGTTVRLFLVTPTSSAAGVGSLQGGFSRC